MRKAFALAALCALAMPAAAQIDGSGTITVGGTAQQVFSAGGGTRRYLFCQNPVAATETLFIGTPGTAGAANGSFELAAGGSLTFGAGDGFVPQGPVSVYAATTAHRFICKQG